MWAGAVTADSSVWENWRVSPCLLAPTTHLHHKYTDTVTLQTLKKRSDRHRLQQAAILFQHKKRRLLPERSETALAVCAPEEASLPLSQVWCACTCTSMLHDSQSMPDCHGPNVPP